MSAKTYVKPLPATGKVEIGIAFDDKKPTPLLYLDKRECGDLIRDMNRAMREIGGGS